MNTSLKIGSVSGLIAGFIAGIVASISNTIVEMNGLTVSFIVNTNIPEIYIPMNVVWGIIFGILFAIVYDIIPGKYISKGLFYGLVIFLITNVRDFSYLWQYVSLLPNILAWNFIGFFQSITYGIILSLLYRFLLIKHGIPATKPVIQTYSVMSGVHVGAIAGLLGGVIALLARVLGGVIGLFPFMYINLESGQFVVEDFSLQLLSGISSQLFNNMVWGIVFGVIFTKVYTLVPGKGIKKGIIYGMMFFLVATFRMSIYFLLWGDLDTFWLWGLVGFFNALFYGLFLGLLYRKFTEPSSVKKEKIRTMQIVNCNHCNAVIPKDSEYCNKCGKKQV